MVPQSLLLFVLPLLGFVSGSVLPAGCPQTLPSPLPNPLDLPIVQELPNPFTYFNGEPLKSAAEWPCRKAELMTLVQEYMYGTFPDTSKETVTAVRNGKTIRITVQVDGRTASFNAVLQMPTGASTVTPSPVVIVLGGINDAAFLEDGVGLATFQVNDVAPDSAVRSGAFWRLYPNQDIGVLAAWGWGFSKVLDGIMQVVPEFNAQLVGVTGCSRYGKAALAAGIFDERITLTLPMSSGLEGIAPWRFQFEELGENEKMENITVYAPFWVGSNLPEFFNNKERLPFDAHLNAALIAPRALIWDIGETDYWTNPRGEASVIFPAAHAVYKWLGVEEQIGVAIRNSWHCDPSGYTNIREFMNRVFFGTSGTRDYTDLSPYTAHTVAFPWINDAPGSA